MTNDRNTNNAIDPQIRELLSPYLDGAVTADERARVDNALAQSAELRAELNSLRQTVQLMQSLPRVPAPRPFTLSAAEVGNAEPKKGFFRKPLWASLTAVAAIALVLLVGVVLFNRSPGSGQNNVQVALAPAAETMQEAAAPTETLPQTAFSAAAAEKSVESVTAEIEMAAPPEQPAASALETVVPVEKSAPQPMNAPAESVAGAAPESTAPPAADMATARSGCDYLPTAPFLSVWQENPTLQSALGCPADPHPRLEPDAYTVKTAFQPFEHGMMIWSDHVAWFPQPIIYVLPEDGTYRRFDDTFNPQTDAATGDELPPNGKIAPMLGFGKLWRTEPGVRELLGWATAPEQSGTGKFQMFEHGEMLSLTQTGKIYAFLRDTGQVEIFDAK